jgi:glutamate carboxypeptidase
MGALTSIEAAAIEQAKAAPLLDQVQKWSAINSGSRNLAGLAAVADLLADELSALPGELQLRESAPADQMRGDGALAPLDHGRNVHLKVRPQAPVQLLFTGHYDTVFAADHPFQEVFWRSEGVLGGPGVADMKGGIAVMLAALRAVEASPVAGQLGYEIVLNSDEEVGSPGSAPLIAQAARGKARGLHLRAFRASRRHAGGRAARQRQFQPVRERPQRSRRPQSRRTAATRSFAPPIGFAPRRGARPGLKVNPAGSTAAGPTMSCRRAVVRVNLPAPRMSGRGTCRGCLRRPAVPLHEWTDHVHGGFGGRPSR